MWTWPALLLAPLLALTEQAVVYSLATPTCQSQREAWLHGVPLVFFAASATLTLLAWSHARRLRQAPMPPVDADRRALRPYFLACVAIGVGALSSLAIVALWIPQWVLSPCAS